MWSTRVVVELFLVILIPSGKSMENEVTLKCHRRIYNHTITKTDSFGRTCWDTVPTVSCWGRCDSHETTDWKFPYTKSFHPVCMHDARERIEVVLKHCDEGAQPNIRTFEILQALSCKCSTCKSSEANCEGLQQRDEKFHPDVMSR